MKRLFAAAIASALLIGSHTLSAQGSADIEALRKEIQALREAQLATQKQLQEVLQLLRTLQQPAAPAQPKMASAVSAAGAPMKGNPNAPLTLVEFSDYQCPFCARHVTQTWPKIMSEYVDSGKVKLVFRDFPLEQIHPQAFKAAEAAHCAGEQDKYWEMHDRLFANQRALGVPELPGHATAIGIDAAKFEECLTSGRHAARVKKDMTEGRAAGVSGTPAFFIGVMNPADSNVKVLRSISGAQPYTAFKTAIDELLTQVAK
jgi:protein-disulfide isomerase